MPECMCGTGWFVFSIPVVRKILTMKGHWSEAPKEVRKGALQTSGPSTTRKSKCKGPEVQERFCPQFQDEGEGFPYHQAILRHQLDVLQFHSIPTLTTQR